MIICVVFITSIITAGVVAAAAVDSVAPHAWEAAARSGGPQFVNTFLVALLVYARIAPLRGAVEAAAGGAADVVPIFAGEFSDFTDG